MRFMLLYRGPATPPDASHAAWPDWFIKLGNAVVDVGSPMPDGCVVHSDGSVSDRDAITLNGYSVVEAEDLDAARDLVKDHPLFAAGEDYAVEIYAIPNAA
jgi:hypothetical protein